MKIINCVLVWISGYIGQKVYDNTAQSILRPFVFLDGPRDFRHPVENHLVLCQR